MGKRVTNVAQIINEKINWEDALRGFLFFKQAQGISKTTLDDYKRHVVYFFNRYPCSWSDNSLKQSLLEYFSDNIKPASYNLRLIYLKAFFEWCYNEGYISNNPLYGFSKRKAQGRIVDIPEDALQKLLLLPNLNTFAGVRDYTLIIFTLDTGIRPKEALSLYISDFDLKHYSVNIPSYVSKTRVQRTLPLLLPTVKAINFLSQVRHPDWGEMVPVFCSNEGTKLNTQTWGDRLELYSNQLGFKIRPYDLRHTFALLYLRNGGHAFGLQKTLGHTDMSMTKRYVNLTNNDLKEIHEKASPLNNLMKKKNRIRNIK